MGGKEAGTSGNPGDEEKNTEEKEEFFGI